MQNNEKITKPKKLLRLHWVLKVTAFILLIALSTFPLVFIVHTYDNPIWNDGYGYLGDIGATEYTETYSYASNARSMMWYFSELATTFTREVPIVEKVVEVEAVDYNDTIEYADTTEVTDIEVQIDPEQDSNYPEYWLKHINQYYDEDDMVYYFEADGTVYKNTNLSYYMITQRENMFNREWNENGKEIKWAFAFTPEYIAENNAELVALNNTMNSFIIIGVVWLILYALCFAYVICAAGRKATNPKAVRMFWFDKIFTEVVLAAMCLAVTVGAFWWAYTYDFYSHTFMMVIYVGFIAVCFAVIYALLLSLIRHIKNRSIFKNLLVWQILKLIIKGARKGGRGLSFCYSKQNPMLKTILIVTLLGLLTMIPFVGFITVPLAIFLTYVQVKAFAKIKSGIAQVRGGDFSTIEMNGFIKYSEFAGIAEDVAQIAAGLNDEVERRLKSERLKTELIVNVSHDIRTPLTSLITYADLLKNEQTDNENIKKYADIISQKSGRLKILTDDLFESAKAASGNINVNLEKVEINSLLSQALAEFDEKIKEASLEIKTNIPAEKIYAQADGRLLWRVVENLLSNALRYSLENSRVYVDVSEDKDTENIQIDIKNISKAELNMSEDEVTERFKRGDLSRNSEGSGLGLDIAMSLMRCQNGSLSVKIDGDLFKVSVNVPAYEQN